ncbi:MAG TPA: sulfate ABC transporter permease subunit [Actinomycetota bacterium]|nr:sulfate ABC transporter permease subunit [Actinomycetota bacterium]
MSAQAPARQDLGTRRTRVVLITVALAYVGILLVAPLGGIVWTALKGGVGIIGSTVGRSDVRHAFELTGILTILTVAVTGVFGVVLALVLARDSFPGRRILSAFVDLPLAISPVIVGLMAVLLFGRGGWFEPFFAARGIQIMFALPSMALVTIFICIPFVIREVIPVLQELGTEEEEAARTLGASRWQTFFRVTLPNIRWGLLYGVALSTARAMGEIGAVLIVSGAIQGQTETATLFIFRALEERQDAAANLVALTLATVSIVLLAAIEIFKRRRAKEMTTT